MGKAWIGWIAASLGSFAVLETTGYIHDGEPGTLSAHVRSWSALHPLVPFSLGVTVGALAFHFWSSAVAPHTTAKPLSRVEQPGSSRGS